MPTAVKDEEEEERMRNMRRIFSILLTAVSVSGRVTELHKREGEKVEFPTKVPDSGKFMRLPNNGIAYITNGAMEHVVGEYSGRVQWDNNTGYVSLSAVKMNDAGEYKVTNDGPSSAPDTYSLKVYIPVSKPQVRITSNEYPCNVQCTVERGTGVTLSWNREGEKRPLVSSTARDAPHLDLPQAVEGGVYTCEAKNSVSNERSAPLTVGDHCSVGVLGQVTELHKREGEKVEFLTKVSNDGNFKRLPNKFSAYITNGALEPVVGEYSGRVQWDINTGYVSLSAVKMEDSGEYKVTDEGPPSVTDTYNLKVYIPVSKPQVSITSNEYPCNVQCTVERGTAVTLSLYREGEKRPLASSSVRDPNPYLDMTVPVERSGTYTCEAKNSVSNERSDPLTVGDHCSAPGILATGADTSTSVAIPWKTVAIVFIVTTVIAAIALIAVVMYYHRLM